MRAFIAIELPEGLQKKLSDFVEILKNPHDKISWVSSKNIHLTLKFLGDVSIDDIESIKNIIQEVANRYSPFEAIVKEAGVFPSQRNPRVVWIGIENGKDNCRNIYTNLEDKLVSIGIPKEERDFTPHITIGRVKYIKDINIFSNLITEHSEDLFGNLRVDSISLIKSTLTPEGAVYERLYISPLAGRRSYG